MIPAPWTAWDRVYAVHLWNANFPTSRIAAILGRTIEEVYWFLAYGRRGR
jgi:hypothetical protein